MKEIMSMFGHNPIMGAILSVGQIIVGYVVKDNMPSEIALPQIYMQLFQLGAWVGAICVAVVTVLGWLKTNTTILDNWKWLKEKK